MAEHPFVIVHALEDSGVYSLGSVLADVPSIKSRGCVVSVFGSDARALGAAQKWSRDKGSSLGRRECRVGLWTLEERSVGLGDVDVLCCSAVALLSRLGDAGGLSGLGVVLVHDLDEGGGELEVLIGVLRYCGKDVRAVVSVRESALVREVQDTVGACPVLCAGEASRTVVGYVQRPVADVRVGAARAAALAVRDGPVLVWMPRVADVRVVGRMLRDSLSSSVSVVEVATLGFARDVGRHVRQGGARGVIIIVAGNLALDPSVRGVRTVVDSCLVQDQVFQPDAPLSAPIIRPASLAELGFRARWGSRCIRLAPSSTVFQPLPPMALRREALTTAVLHARRCQARLAPTEPLASFPWLVPPSPLRVARAAEELFALGALDEEGNITSAGHWAARAPCNIRDAMALWAACERDAPHGGCAQELANALALSSVSNLWLPPEKQDEKAKKQRRFDEDSEDEEEDDGRLSLGRFVAEEGDHITLLNVMLAWERNGADAKWCEGFGLRFGALRRARARRDEMLGALAREVAGSTTHALWRRPEGERVEALLRSLCCGHFLSAAEWVRADRYRTAREGRDVFLSSSSALRRRPSSSSFPRCIVYTDALVGVGGDGAAEDGSVVQLLEASAVNPEWILAGAPRYFRRHGRDGERQRWASAPVGSARMHAEAKVAGELAAGLVPSQPVFSLPTSRDSATAARATDRPGLGPIGATVPSSIQAVRAEQKHSAAVRTAAAHAASALAGHGPAAGTASATAAGSVRARVALAVGGIGPAKRRRIIITEDDEDAEDDFRIEVGKTDRKKKPNQKK